MTSFANLSNIRGPSLPDQDACFGLGAIVHFEKQREFELWSDWMVDE